MLARRFVIPGVLMLAGLVCRLGGFHLAAPVGLVVFGAAVVASSFLLAWAAEAAQLDISGGFAIAILAFIAVLPEYAVDLYFAYRAGSDPSYEQFAAANMTGSNRLLLGLGWPLVVLIAVHLRRKRSDPGARFLDLPQSARLEVGFLLIAGLIAFVMPVTGEISMITAFILIGWFCWYLYRMITGEPEEPHLIGTSARIGALPQRRRRILVVTLFICSAAVILASAEPFANSLVDTGRQLGIDEFLLVQWLAPLSSEAPEFIVAVLFALRGNGPDAITTLISSKVNQWTLLIGSLPIAYLVGGGGSSLPLDARQVEEVLLTAAQTLMGIAILLALRFSRAAAWTLLGLFAVQFALPDEHARLVVSACYLAIAAVIGVRQYRYLIPTLLAPFRPLPQVVPD